MQGKYSGEKLGIKHLCATLLALSLLFLSGCAAMEDVRGPLKLPSGDERDLTIPKYAETGEFVCNAVDGDYPCHAVVCLDDKLLGSRWLSNFFGTSLKGGSCDVGVETNKEVWERTLSKDDDFAHVRPFMFGFGPNFYYTDKANLYCGYALQLATKWMVGEVEPPIVPESEPAECWLERDTLPLYIYYTQGNYIDSERSGEIAKELGNSGPAILATEVDWDSSNPQDVRQIKWQIDKYRENCPDCLIALAIKSGDTEALHQILGKPGDPSPYYNKVNIVGFGFRANDYPTCDYMDIIGQNFLYSRDILRNYSKPTMWLYVGASRGKNIDGSCEWSPERVEVFYRNIFEITQFMASTGILGVSFYEFRDRTGPLPCNDVQGCDFGLVEADGDQKHPELNTWNKYCTIFKNQKVKPALVFSRNSYGDMCDFARNDDLARQMEMNKNSLANLDYSEVKMTPIQKNFGCGENCIAYSPIPDNYNDVSRYKHFELADCRLHGEIDNYAISLDLSPLFIRAIMQRESEFKYNAMSCSVLAYGTICNPGNLNLQQACAGMGIEGCPPDPCTEEGGNPNTKPCGLGIANIPIMSESEWASDPYIQKCKDVVFNPFDAGMSGCYVSYKFRDALDAAKLFVDSNWDTLSFCDKGIKEEQRGWAIYYIAATIYNGGEDAAMAYTLTQFMISRDLDGTCKGDYVNYIDYLRLYKGYEYAAQVLSAYKAAVDRCGSDCVA